MENHFKFVHNGQVKTKYMWIYNKLVTAIVDNELERKKNLKKKNV